MVEPVLYSFRRCPYAMRARLALAVSATTCELREIKLSAKPADMLRASPKGTVPVLVQADGKTIEQSLDIMHAALGRNDPESWLDRGDAALIAINDGPFKYDLDRYKYPERHDGDALARRASGLEFLREVESRLATSPFLCGSTRGLADAAIIPFVRQFAAVDSSWFESQPLPHVQRWLSDYLASPLFAAIMLRVPVWSPGAAPVFFPARQ
ncbi:glutathione S-transferase [Novosphingobium sp. PhB165]|uniref:glutathione S-transferase n=1 Tax=Novosphingobium sp. PhB165 TaxID=2485105 RepID=UPI00104C758A|nr:glutathione S-transferase [Novosphingobium sp. PhB165]TCM16048.1 glutathione S-transferase [Novosphingobium sp. PhB165]